MYKIKLNMTFTCNSSYTVIPGAYIRTVLMGFLFFSLTLPYNSQIANKNINFWCVFPFFLEVWVASYQSLLESAILNQETIWIGNIKDSSKVIIIMVDNASLKNNLNYKQNKFKKRIFFKFQLVFLQLNVGCFFLLLSNTFYHSSGISKDLELEI